jgi:hypothetical protein
MMTRLLQDPDLPARFPMETRSSRDENGETLVVVRCNDGTIWLDTGNATVPWRQLPAIPEPTAEEVEAAERVQQEEKERLADAEAERLLGNGWRPTAPTISQYLPPPYRRLP